MNLNLVVANTQDLTQFIRLIEFNAADGSTLPAYTAGAHINVELGNLGTRSYSLIDWSLPHKHPKTYTIAVQFEADGEGGSKRMHQLQLGQAITTSAPKNDFALANDAAPSLLLAGGIGVTPLISMAASLQGKNRPFEFHYAGRSRPVMGFVEEMSQAFGSALKIHFDDEAALTLSSLFSKLDDGTHVYICGPRGMIDAAKLAATEAGVADELIHIELFSTPEATGTDTPFEVELNSTGAVYTVPVGKSIIETLENEGIDLMYDCQRGDCGICQTDVISGEPDHRDVVLSDAERESGKVMQICVSRSKSPRLVLDL